MRKKKKPRVDRPLSSSDEDEKSEDEEETPSPPPRVRQKRNHVERTEEGAHEDPIDDDEHIGTLISQDKWAFCCAVCACSDDVKRRTEGQIYVVEGDGCFPHRACCHNIRDEQPEWASSYQTAKHRADKAVEEETVEEDKKNAAETIWKATSEEMDKSFHSAKNIESKIENHSRSEDPTSQLYTNEDYNKESTNFLAHVAHVNAQTTTKEGAVVLDLFSGMGTLQVALKRISIATKKVIYCEQDKVATYVYEQQHVNNDTDKSTEWVYYPSFEAIANDASSYDAFMNAHAPIDIVVAGPPCQDFTGINADRKGLEGHKGQYMMQTAKLVRQIREDKRQKEKPLYYLLENVVLRNDKELPLDQGEKERVKKALGCSWDPVVLDAMYVSPSQRLRSFFTNIRLGSWSEQADKFLECNPSAVLEDGFRLAANLEVYEPDLSAKTLTFLASKSRLNDDRMLVYRPRDPSCPDTKKYVSRIITRSERLALMGFPSNYLDCLEELYKSLSDQGHGACHEHIGHWTETLDTSLRKFQGAFHGVSNPFEFSYAPALEWPHIEMRLIPYSSSSKTKEFLNSDDYGKRLLGNAISVPVLEFCLMELTKVFAKRQYTGYEYTYAWREPEVKVKSEPFVDQQQQQQVRGGLSVVKKDPQDY